MATMRLALLLAVVCAHSLAVRPPPAPNVPDRARLPSAQRLARPVAQATPRLAMRSDDTGSLRAGRGAAADTDADIGVFDAPSAAETDDHHWKQKTAAIIGDMRAHLLRRHNRAEADLIGPKHGPIKGALVGVVDFFRSRYFRNARRSIALGIGAWLWYVFNTNTHVPPEFDD